MANTVSLLSYANTFGDWVVTTNSLAVENNNLAANNYQKSTGTLYLNDPNLGLQVANNAVVQGGLRVAGVGSFATVQNNLTVGGQVYLTNSTYSLITTGQANVGGLLLAQGSGTGLQVLNNAVVGGTLNVGSTTNTSGVLNALSDFNVSGNSILTGSLTVTGPTTLNGPLTVNNNQINTQNISVAANVNANNISATNYVTANTISANNWIQSPVAAISTGYVNTLQANTNIVTNALTVTGTGTADTFTANTRVNAPVVSVGTSLNAGAAVGNFNALTSGSYVANSYFSGPIGYVQTLYTNALQANTNIVTAAQTITGTSRGDTFVANTTINTPFLSVGSTVGAGGATGYFNNLNAGYYTANSYFSGPTGYIQTLYTNALQANTNIVTSALTTTNTITGNNINANTAISVPLLTVTNNAVVSNNISGLNVTLRNQALANTVVANNSVQTPVGFIGALYANTIQANTNIVSSALTTTGTSTADTVTANTAINSPLVNITTKLDANAATAYFNNLYLQNALTVAGNFIITGTTVYSSNTFRLSDGAAFGISNYIQVGRGSSGANAAIRWNEPSKYWDILDVNSGSSYYKILTSDLLSNSGVLNSTSNIATSAAVNTANTYLQGQIASINNNNTAGYAQANAANDLATSAYNKANTGGVFSGDVTVTGNLIVTGTTTTVNTATVTTKDSLIKLADGNPGDNFDIGFYGTYVSSGTKYTGLVRQAGGNYWLLAGITTDPTTNTIPAGSYTQANTTTLNANVVGYITSNGVELYKYTTASYAQANAATNSAQSAYNQANATNTYATSGYAQANAATNSAQAAYNLANTHTTQISVIQGVDLTQNTNITAVNNYATSSYNLANTNATNITATNNYATSAYAQANAATNSAQSAYNKANNSVQSVGASSPVSSSGGTTPTISLSSAYGDTQNPYASKTANFFLAAPNGVSGAPSFRAVVAADIPTLNQNTTGQAGSVASSVTFNNGGSGASSGTTYNGSGAITVSYNTVGAPSTSGTNASGTWGINISGNAATVTNGVYTNGSYSNPSWLTSISGSIVSGNISGNASNITSYTINQSVGTGNDVQHNSLGVGTSGSGTTGEIRATNDVTAFYSSDRKFKENIKDIQNALDIVDAIGGKTFDWTDAYIQSKGGEDGYFVRKSDFGVVAQDVESVFPVAVRTKQDGSLAVDYEKLCALAFQAIKELKDEIENLKSKK